MSDILKDDTQMYNYLYTRTFHMIVII